MRSSVPGSPATELDPAFLAMALRPYRALMLGAVRKAAWAKSVHLAGLKVAGVPGVRASVDVFVWPEPLGATRRLGVDVVGVDGKALRVPVGLTFELESEERPIVVGPELVLDRLAVEVEGRRVMTVGAVRWIEVDGERVEQEVQRLRSDGSPVFAQVDTGVYRYRMTCACGRARWSKANSLHQVVGCRVCTRADRLRRRALLQYKERHGHRR